MDSKRFKKHAHNHISALSNKGSGYLLYLLKCISPTAMAHHQISIKSIQIETPRASLEHSKRIMWCTYWMDLGSKMGEKKATWCFSEALRPAGSTSTMSKTPEKHWKMAKNSSLWECTSSNIYAWSIVQNFKASEHTWSEKQKLLWMQITGATNIRILGVAITFKRIGRTRETALWLRATASNPDVVLNE